MQGVSFEVKPGTKSVLYGTLTVVSADNISSQLLGGFIGLHSAIRTCRDCLATKTSMQYIVSFNVHSFLHHAVISLVIYI